MNQQRTPQVPPSPKSSGMMKLAWVGGGFAAVAVIAAVAFWSLKPKGPPRFNAPIETVVRFCISEEVYKLPVADQKLYYNCLDERKDEIEAAWETGKLSDAEFKAAKERRWFGPQMTNMDKYHLLPSDEEKIAMLDRLIDEKERDKDKDKKKDNEKATGPDLFDSALARPEPKRDEFQELIIPQNWPKEDRIRWLQYREAIKQRENDREKAEKAAAKAATTQRTTP